MTLKINLELTETEYETLGLALYMLQWDKDSTAEVKEAVNTLYRKIDNNCTVIK